MTRIAVEVVLALPDRQEVRSVEVAPGATLETAIREAGFGAELDEGRAVRVGIFGRLRTLGEPVRDGDRVELYRALLADPKATRRKRAAAGRIRGAARPDSG